MRAFLLQATSLLLCLTPCCVRAQNSTAAPQADAAAPTVLQVRSRLVVLDVAVRDAQGRPVHSLTADAFRVEEDRAPQTIRHFDAHTPDDGPHSQPPPPALPPGSFTNYTPVSEDGTLNVLLIDALNTPANDQIVLRDQLRKYVEYNSKGHNTAIFGLNSRLVLLQGFTQDAGALRDAIEHRAKRGNSGLLDDPNGTHTESTKASDNFSDLGAAGSSDALAGLQQFESDTQAFQLTLRAQYTLDALSALGHYLASFPGRKNLIWFSGSFPINLLPDSSVNDGFRGMQQNAEQLRQTAELLTDARVAVYPVDPRGVQTSPAFDAANAGRRYVSSGASAGNAIRDFNTRQATEHTSMERLAQDTGGQAVYGTNDLAQAVSLSVADGSDYYTLTYTPTNHSEGKDERHIHVALMGAAAQRGYTLSYRRGYFAAPTAAAASDDAAMSAYTRLALAFGAPQPQDILFQARVSRTSSPHGYDVRFGALANGISFARTSGDRLTASLQFYVLAFRQDGTIVDQVSKRLQLNLSPAEYRAILDSGIGLSLTVADPAKDVSFIRTVVQDLSAQHVGALQIATPQVP